MKSQRECLLAVMDAYRDLVGRAVTIAEVSEWSLGRGLTPTPRRGSPDEAFEHFETRLAKAKELGLLPDEESPHRMRGEAANAMLNSL